MVQNPDAAVINKPHVLYNLLYFLSYGYYKGLKQQK